MPGESSRARPAQGIAGAGRRRHARGRRARQTDATGDTVVAGKIAVPNFFATVVKQPGLDPDKSFDTPGAVDRDLRRWAGARRDSHLRQHHRQFFMTL
jgi:hypothetical protein